MIRQNLVALLLLGACNGNDSNLTVLVPEIVVLPESVDFGEVVGGETASQTVEITNNGRADLVLSGLSFQSGETSLFSAVLESDEVTLEPDAVLSLPISFSPIEWTESADTMLIDWNDDELSPWPVPLSGTGVDIDRPDIGSDPADCLDFGTVAPGETKSQVLTILNGGEDDLEISDTQVLGSGAFSFQPDLDGTRVSAGGVSATIVTYAPTTSDGDSATFTLYSNDPDEPAFEVCLEGNGGGSSAYPVAVIDCPDGATPMSTVSLDGSGSYDPGANEPLTYAWSLSEAPGGSESALDSTDLSATSVFLDLAGDYTISLVVTNSLGVPSAPAKCDVAAVPVEDIRVELVWDKDGTDMDLHLSEDVADLYDVPGDVSFCNLEPDWGVADVVEDDPDLVQLDDDGLGPEAVQILSPSNGEFLVRVHYYEDESEGSSTATVRLYIYGSLAEEMSRTLSRNEVWDVAWIRWPYGYIIPVDSEPEAATRRDCPTD